MITVVPDQFKLQKKKQKNRLRYGRSEMLHTTAAKQTISMFETNISQYLMRERQDELKKDACKILSSVYAQDGAVTGA